VYIALQIRATDLPHIVKRTEPILSTAVKREGNIFLYTLLHPLCVTSSTTQQEKWMSHSSGLALAAHNSSYSVLWGTNAGVRHQYQLFSEGVSAQGLSPYTVQYTRIINTFLYAQKNDVSAQEFRLPKNFTVS